MEGSLIVFEGPDGVGKSTLHGRLLERLEARGIPVMGLAFPGHTAGSLGELVYRLHHGETQVAVERVSPFALQVLHVAAHVDMIENRLLPALNAGTTVLLDRFWWSTWVYGMADSVHRHRMDALVRVEEMVWAPRRPTLAFLVTRSRSLRPEHSQQHFDRLVGYYRELSSTVEHPVVEIRNEGPLEQSVEEVLDAALAHMELPGA